MAWAEDYMYEVLQEAVEALSEKLLVTRTLRQYMEGHVLQEEVFIHLPRIPHLPPLSIHGLVEVDGEEEHVVFAGLMRIGDHTTPPGKPWLMATYDPETKAWSEFRTIRE